MKRPNRRCRHYRWDGSGALFDGVIFLSSTFLLIGPGSRTGGRRHSLVWDAYRSVRVSIGRLWGEWGRSGAACVCVWGGRRYWGYRTYVSANGGIAPADRPNVPVVMGYRFCSAHYEDRAG